MIKVRQARSGKGFEVDIRFRWPDGSTFRERRNAPVTSKSGAQRWAEARERELLSRGKQAAEFDPKPVAVPTLREFWPRVVSDHYRAERKKPSTIDTAERIHRVHLAPMLDDLPLDRIDAAAVAKLKGALADASPKTTNNVLSVLSRALRCAVDWEVLREMPCRIKLLRTVEPRMQWYEREDYRRLVEASKARRRVFLLVLLAGSAGLRRGEIIALRWADVDVARRQIRVSTAIWQREEAAPKGGRHRVVPMTPELAAALKEHRHLGDRVLYSEEGRELSNRSIRNWLSWAQRAAKLPANGGIHILRHTFCSHLAAAGVPAKAIQELAGHADLATTMRYMHLSPGDRDAAMDALTRYHGHGAMMEQSSAACDEQIDRKRRTLEVVGAIAMRHGDDTASTWVWNCTPMPFGLPSDEQLESGLRLVHGDVTIDELVGRVIADMDALVAREHE